jgi:hypothetical protein
VSEIDWSAFGVGLHSQGSLDKVIVNRVFEVVVGNLDTQIHFPILIAGRNQSAHMAKASPTGGR